MRFFVLFWGALSVLAGVWLLSMAVVTGNVSTSRDADTRLSISRDVLKAQVWRRTRADPPRALFDAAALFDGAKADAADEEIARTTRRWLTISPTRSDLWLLLCTVQQPRCPGGAASKTLQMAYLVGIGSRAEWPTRIALGLGGRDPNDPILGEFLKYDIATGLREVPDARAAITMIYQTADEPGRAQLLDILKSVDPKVAGIIAASPTPSER